MSPGMTVTDVEIGHARQRRSPDGRAAIEYLLASGAVAIRLIEVDGAYVFRTGPLAKSRDIPSGRIFWISATAAKPIVRRHLCLKISLFEPKEARRQLPQVVPFVADRQLASASQSLGSMPSKGRAFQIARGLHDDDMMMVMLVATINSLSLSRLPGLRLES
jgi:hypothetical protein